MNRRNSPLNKFSVVAFKVGQQLILLPIFEKRLCLFGKASHRHSLSAARPLHHASRGTPPPLRRPSRAASRPPQGDEKLKHLAPRQPTRDQPVGGEVGDDLAAVLGHHDFLFDAGGAGAVLGDESYRNGARRANRGVMSVPKKLLGLRRGRSGRPPWIMKCRRGESARRNSCRKPMSTSLSSAARPGSDCRWRAPRMRSAASSLSAGAERNVWRRSPNRSVPA